MPDFDRDKFKEYWKATEVIREYQRMLFTFGDMELPYVLVAEHSRFKDRTVVRKGVVLVQRPHIMLPPYYGGPEFKEGFEHAIPPDAVYLLEYGNVQRVLDRFDNQMESQEDTDTGLIKGVLDGADICLMRYSLGLAIKSAPGNISEFFEHLRRRRGEPIRPDERITDEDIRRLFG